jgi:hypothetical protein
MKQSPFFAGLLALCLVGFSACPGSFMDDPLQTPANFTVAAVPYVACLSWDAVPGVTGYRIRLNGEPVRDVSTTLWRHVRSVTLNDEYTVSALYSGGRESHPAGPWRIGHLGNRYPLAPTEADNSEFIVSAAGTARPAQWYDAVLLPGQTAHYYIIPIDNSYGQYRIWWNDFYDGDMTKTLDIGVSAQWGKTSVSITPTPVDLGYTNAGITINTNSPDNTGSVVLRVEPYGSGNAGTYGIAYTYQ